MCGRFYFVGVAEEVNNPPFGGWAGRICIEARLDWDVCGDL